MRIINFLAYLSLTVRLFGKWMRIICFHCLLVLLRAANTIENKLIYISKAFDFENPFCVKPTVGRINTFEDSENETFFPLLIQPSARPDNLLAFDILDSFCSKQQMM
mmetsp:Transcript_20340/g.29493  ORF Transcript_20340/g.29493 Transcript_20340/m.29493 type:complete len:107 (+) Transcript_20340:948-1268(+)